MSTGSPGNDHTVNVVSVSGVFTKMVKGSNDGAGMLALTGNVTASNHIFVKCVNHFFYLLRYIATEQKIFCQ